MPERLLRRHIGGGADDHSSRGQTRPIACDGEAEIAELGDAIGSQPNIGRFQIAMNDAARMRVVERAANVACDAHRIGGGESMICRAPQQIIDRATRHVLAHDVGLAAFLADIVDADDVGIVAELAHRARLAADPFAAGSVETRSFDQRECDVAIDFVIVREKNRFAAALAEQPDHPVSATDERIRAGKIWRSFLRRVREPTIRICSAQRRTRRRT